MASPMRMFKVFLFLFAAFHIFGGMLNSATYSDDQFEVMAKEVATLTRSSFANEASISADTFESEPSIGGAADRAGGAGLGGGGGFGGAARGAGAGGGSGDYEAGGGVRSERLQRTQEANQLLHSILDKLKDSKRTPRARDAYAGLSKQGGRPNSWEDPDRPRRAGRAGQRGGAEEEELAEGGEGEEWEEEPPLDEPAQGPSPAPPARAPPARARRAAARRAPAAARAARAAARRAAASATRRPRGSARRRRRRSPAPPRAAPAPPRPRRRRPLRPLPGRRRRRRRHRRGGAAGGAPAGRTRRWGPDRRQGGPLRRRRRGRRAERSGRGDRAAGKGRARAAAARPADASRRTAPAPLRARAQRQARRAARPADASGGRRRRRGRRGRRRSSGCGQGRQQGRQGRRGGRGAAGAGSFEEEAEEEETEEDGAGTGPAAGGAGRRRGRAAGAKGGAGAAAGGAGGAKAGAGGLKAGAGAGAGAGGVKAGAGAAGPVETAGGGPGAAEADVKRLRAYVEKLDAGRKDVASELAPLERLLDNRATPPPLKGALYPSESLYARRIGEEISCEQWNRVFGLREPPLAPSMRFIDAFNRHREAVRLFETCFLPSICADGTNPFSQLGQEFYVLNKLGRDRPGFFVDIGAYDGIWFSNTYFLEKCLGWTGVCIEANPYEYNRLKALHRSCAAVNVAVAGGNEAKAKFRGAGELGGLVAHLGAPRADRIAREAPAAATLEVQAVALGRALELAGVPPGRPIDYLSVDVSGAELALLQAIDWKKVDISVMTVDNSAGLQEPCDLVARHGFLCDRLNWDDVFVKRGLPTDARSAAR
eukprot:tig00000601_g2297.t1